MTEKEIKYQLIVNAQELKFITNAVETAIHYLGLNYSDPDGSSKIIKLLSNPLISIKDSETND